MNDTKQEFVEILKSRFKNYVIQSTALYRMLPNTGESKIFGNQFLKSASSAGANYRAACRARSGNEFFAKSSIVVEELDESCFWIEIMLETNLIDRSKAEELLKEGNELLAIMARARKNTYKK